jgi:aldehyde:ferredoxin oxidoreductase
VSYFLLKEIPRGIDAFDPQNRLIVALGPLTGLPVPGATRSCVGAKSPLSGGYAKSEAGGFFPMALKKTGYDAVVIRGRADRPVYLLMTDAGAEVRDASHLWGEDGPESAGCHRGRDGTEGDPYGRDRPRGGEPGSLRLHHE